MDAEILDYKGQYSVGVYEFADPILYIYCACTILLKQKLPEFFLLFFYFLFLKHI